MSDYSIEFVCFIRVSKRVFEEPEFKLDAQHAGHGLIDRFNRNRSIEERLDKEGVVIVGGLDDA